MQFGCSPLWLACSNGHQKVIETLVRAKANVNIQNEVSLFNEHLQSKPNPSINDFRGLSQLVYSIYGDTQCRACSHLICQNICEDQQLLSNSVVSVRTEIVTSGMHACTASVSELIFPWHTCPVHSVVIWSA